MGPVSAADAYVVGEDDSSDDEPSAKRARPGFTEIDDAAGETAESQLEAMLAAESAAGKTAELEAPIAPMASFTSNFSAGIPGMEAAAAAFGLQGMTIPGLHAAVEAAAASRPTTDFSRPVQNLPTREVPVPRGIVDSLMTPEHRELLLQESGADVEWAPEDARVNLKGSAESLRRATRLLQRVLMHCHWGHNRGKVSRLLRPQNLESAICRLSPMNTLRPFEKMMNTPSPTLSIGKDKSNDIVISDAIVSRVHCVLELDAERGAVYAIDCSTNGTFLNGVRLPSKDIGKVLVSHGDELLFKDPKGGDGEFGYIVNLNEIAVRAHVQLTAPRRIVAYEDVTTTSRD